MANIQLQKIVPITHPLAVPQEIFYHIAWRSRRVQAGSHKTNMRGAGSDFASFVPLLDYPDPRRLDVRASLKTIPKQFMVRTFFERSAIHVYVVNDLSASMWFSGKGHKPALITEIAEAIAWSVVRQGDAFGMLSCQDDVLEKLSVLPSCRQSQAQEVRQQLAGFFSNAFEANKTASAMPLAAKKIGVQKSLVFLISDFHWPEDLLKQTLQAFCMHDVVPIVLWDEAEFEELPEWGWAKVRELESGIQRSLFMRPSLHQKIREYAQIRKHTLGQFCQQQGARLPFFVNSHFDATALSRHLLGS